ncbi:hypothetical protein LMG27177_01568 [Paraburkholderia fynbosensis]|uniref:Uncharacterized protein n=1 Tax=Paraburkholderia fynbosensis TaxID=1200993 RepID=A0A6J5FTY1_9BURK|nr:hypothetical protein LMG27177_01568 [Paraburkholderia fynbosensis]
MMRQGARVSSEHRLALCPNDQYFYAHWSHWSPRPTGRIGTFDIAGAIDRPDLCRTSFKRCRLNRTKPGWPWRRGDQRFESVVQMRLDYVDRQWRARTTITYLFPSNRHRRQYMYFINCRRMEASHNDWQMALQERDSRTWVSFEPRLRPTRLNRHETLRVTTTVHFGRHLPLKVRLAVDALADALPNLMARAAETSPVHADPA